jgi:hypothetical protein
LQAVVSAHACSNTAHSEGSFLLSPRLGQGQTAKVGGIMFSLVDVMNDPQCQPSAQQCEISDVYRKRFLRTVKRNAHAL